MAHLHVLMKTAIISLPLLPSNCFSMLISPCLLILCQSDLCSSPLTILIIFFLTFRLVLTPLKMWSP